MDVALTFDDGYKKHLDVARHLAKRGIKATFFVIAGLKEYMGKELLSPAEIKEIASLGHEIGSHTMTHIDMTKAPEDVIVRELVESKKYLTELVGAEVTSFAYPYGPHSGLAAKLARQIYKIARTTYIGPAEGYNLLDEHGCVVAFNLRLSNLYELAKLRALDRLVLFTHSPSTIKLGLILTPLRLLGVKFLTISELSWS
ncbi:MAG: polysaccharide deacetylase family protein [Candidatus Verstraetearchaeota archaeon]|nr:polysaccharide deacetylase family protein [Candidatus Verstraetearchaeota archaeon]